MSVEPFYSQSPLPTSTPPPEEEQAALNQLLATAAFKKDLKEVRSKIRAAIRAGAAYKRDARQRIRDWKLSMAEHILAIKTTKKEVFQALRQSVSATEQKAARRRMAAAKAAFLKKYKLKYWQRRKLGLNRGRLRRSDTWALEWLARIRI
jgi:hypothetical protein